MEHNLDSFVTELGRCGVARHSINLGPPLKVTFHHPVEGRFVMTIKASKTFWGGHDDWNEVWMSLEGRGADGREGGHSFPQALDRVVQLAYKADGREKGVHKVMMEVQEMVASQHLPATEQQIKLLIAIEAEKQISGATAEGILRLLDAWMRDAKRSGLIK